MSDWRHEIGSLEDWEALKSELAYYEREPEPYDDPYFRLRPWLKRTRYVPGSESSGGGYFDHTGG